MCHDVFMRVQMNKYMYDIYPNMRQEVFANSSSEK